VEANVGFFAMQSSVVSQCLCFSAAQMCSSHVPARVCTKARSKTWRQAVQPTFSQHPAACPRRHADESESV